MNAQTLRHIQSERLARTRHAWSHARLARERAVRERALVKASRYRAAAERRYSDADYAERDRMVRYAMRAEAKMMRRYHAILRQV